MLTGLKDSIVDFICRVFHVVRLFQYEDLERRYKTVTAQLESAVRDRYTLAEQSKELQQAAADMTEKVKKYEEQMGALESLKKEVKDVNLQLEQVKELQEIAQKVLSKAFHEDPEFGFAKSLAIPGSSSVTSSVEDLEDGGKVALLLGRTILDDQFTAELQNTDGYNNRLNKVIEILQYLGIYDRMVKDLRRCGALEYTIAYNDDCTAAEIYWRLRALVPEKQMVEPEEPEEK